MAAKKQDKSSKTAHVLNLLTKPSQASQPAPLQETPDNSGAAEQTAAAAPQPAAAPAAPLVPPVLQNARAEENLSEQIRGALADDLAAALSEAPADNLDDGFGEAYFEAYDDLTEGYEQLETASVPAAAPAPAPAAAPAPAPAAQVSQASPANQPNQPNSANQATQPDHAPAKTGLLYLNIMQPLVEAAAPRYAKMFGVCDCPRCQADVRAYALTHLKPHYAVYRQEDSIPMLTLYETRYASQVATILTQACEVVKENPRHRYRY